MQGGVIDLERLVHWSHDDFVIAAEHPSFPRLRIRTRLRSWYGMPVFMPVSTYPAAEVEA
jgi:hypothetical protein